jgi:hypothetical protein
MLHPLWAQKGSFLVKYTCIFYKNLREYTCIFKSGITVLENNEFIIKKIKVFNISSILCILYA